MPAVSFHRLRLVGKALLGTTRDPAKATGVPAAVAPIALGNVSQGCRASMAYACSSYIRGDSQPVKINQPFSISLFLQPLCLLRQAVIAELIIFRVGCKDKALTLGPTCSPHGCLLHRGLGANQPAQD